jgi:hypothetical protein
LLGRHGEEQRMLPKLGVVQATRTFEALVNPRGPILPALALLSGWHSRDDGDVYLP